MQKKLIALAVAGMIAAPAFAQSNVTVYGRLDYGYLNADADATVGGSKGSVETSSTGFGTGALTTSRLGVMGSEDLGNGLKANFQLELRIADTSAFGSDTGADLADSFDTRLALVGLSGGFGSVTLGRQYTAVETAWGVGSAGGLNNAIGAAYTGLALDLSSPVLVSGIKFNNTRSDELITYKSPSMNGFQATVQYGKGETDATGVGSDISQKEFGLALTYGNGPLNVALGYSKEKAEAAGATTSEPTQVVLSANYDFGAAKVFGLYADGSNDKGAGAADDQDRDVWELGVNVPVGMATTLVASYYRGDSEDGATKADIDGYQLGAIYSLSKRTKLYALYGNAEVDVDSMNNAETTNFALGVRHDF
ncbi:MAG: porin [Rhodocyclaceae bacterium]|nr:porin [Rhodocyclaceae bacterium]